ncbi:MAG: hypothetical protein JXA08_09700 [Methanomicrobiaceae archaeon]|nr:hypothetical protein [Methanomicrobiaceae archaeon]
MNSSRKRTVLLVATVLIGSVLVLFDAPLELVLLGTTAVGMLLLVLLGGLRKEEEEQPAEKPKGKPEKEIKKDGISFLNTIRLPGIITRLRGRKAPKNDTAGAGTPKKAPGRSALFSGLREKIAQTPVKEYSGRVGGAFMNAVDVFTSVFRKKPVGPEDLEKIDNMLDRTVAEPVSQDDFPGFDDFDLDLEDMDEDSPVHVPAQENMELDELDALAVNDILDAAGENPDEERQDGLSFDFDSGVEDMLVTADAEPVSVAPGLDVPDTADMPPLPSDSSAGGEARISLSEMPDMESLSPLSDLEGDFGELDGIELDDIEIEGEFEAVQEESISAPAGVQDTPPKKPEPVEEPVVITEDEIGSFGASDGSMGFMDELKSETKTYKSAVDESLLRDLKDVPVNAEELATDLEGVNEYLNKQVQTARKRVNIEDR